MSPTQFPEANTTFGPSADLEESQCFRIPAYRGEVRNPKSSVDGALICVVAWMPTNEEIEALKSGVPVYLSCLGGLPPHFLTTNFEDATNPA